MRESSVQCFSFILTLKGLYSIFGFLLTHAAISFHNLFTSHPGTAVTRQLVFRIPYMEVVQSAKKARKYETSGKISTSWEMLIVRVNMADFVWLYEQYQPLLELFVEKIERERYSRDDWSHKQTIFQEQNYAKRSIWKQ